MLIIYDGDCPFCRAYVRLLRLQKAGGTVEMLSARSADSRIQAYWQQGHDLNAGMLGVLNQQVYAGADAMQVLASCSSGSDYFNRLHHAIFSRRRLSALLYPLLKFGRRLTLFLLRVPPLSQSNLR
jgi:predicted DCC family thiol-disulfide oxidoreductase YuxK